MFVGFQRNCRLRSYFYETLTVFLLPDSILWHDQLCVYVNDGEPDPVFLWSAYCRRSARTSLHRGILSNYSLAVTSYTHYPGSRIKQGLINTFILHYTHTHTNLRRNQENFWTLSFSFFFSFFAFSDLLCTTWTKYCIFPISTVLCWDNTAKY